MGCATSTVKYILFIFNLLCALLGIAVIAVGAVLLGSIKSFQDFVDSITVLNTPIIVIVLGSLIFIIAFFGCCGAIRESHCMTITYSVFLFLLMVLQIAAVTLIFVTRRQQEDLIGAAVEAVWKRSDDRENTKDYVQRTFECCGVNGRSEYLVLVPDSCQNYTIGCKTAVTNSFMKIINWIAYIGIGIFSVELVGFIFACCLANHIRNNKRRSTY